MKLKKILALALSLVLILGMAGCNTNDDGKIKIGLVKLVDHPSLNEINESIKDEFYKINANVEFIEKNANGEVSTLPSIMQSLVGENVDMIIPIATPTAQAALAATSTIPIVFAAVSTPVEAGLTSSLDAPDKNVTGVSDVVPVDDIFKLASVLTPDVKTFGLFYNSSEVNSVATMKSAKEYCDKNNIAYKESTISSTADIQQTASVLAEQVDAIFIPTDNMVASAMPTFISVTNGAKIPVYAGADSLVKDGAFATVGVNYTLLGQQTAQMANKILNGQKISDTPIETMREYAKMVNMAEADLLGIEIADDVKSELTVLVD